MRQAPLILAVLLTACGGSGGGGASGGGGGEHAGSETRSAVQTADLTGLYEAEPGGGQRARMCMTRDPKGTVSFGIVTETPSGSCGGAGVAVRTEGVLRLTMAGDQQCVIDAPIAGTAVTMPAAVARGCAYYCAPGASLAGETFEKTGGTAGEAMRALDLAGGPLCG